jgi:hypothetical protein
MKFPKIPYLNQLFKPSPNSTVSYIWTGFAWDIYTEDLENKSSGIYVVNQNSIEVNGETPTGVLDGINRKFTLKQSPITGSDEIYLNGLRQTRNLDYTITGQDIEFKWAPYENSNILCNYQVLNGLRIEGESAVLVNDGIFTKYSLQYTPVAGSERVYINGLRAKEGIGYDYILIDNVIQINYPLDENSRVLCDYNY